MDIITFREAVLADAPRIHELHLASVRALSAPFYERSVIDGWLAGRSPAGYARSISSGAMLVAEASGVVIGFCEGTPGEVRAVFVDPDGAGKGLGAQLLTRALALAQVGQSAPVRLESTLNAVRFYERHGFRQLGPIALRRNGVDVPACSWRDMLAKFALKLTGAARPCASLALCGSRARSLTLFR
jgi:GNAT superfamily N-acetyltransferase